MTAVATLLLLPLLWSGVVFALRAVALHGRPALSDAAEKMVLALMLAPLAAGLVLPVLPVPAPVVMNSMLPHLDGFEPDIAAPAATVAHQGWSVTRLLPQLASAIWAAGFVLTVGRLIAAHLRFARIASAARPEGDGVYVTTATVPAFAWNRRRIIVPATLRTTVTAEQFGLIIAHERAHQRRHDPAWFLTLGWFQSLLWFNPFLHLQVRACRLSAELACDDAVTRAMPDKRRVYAEALVRIVREAAPSPATIPGLSDLSTCKTRLETIMRQATPPKALITLSVLLCLTLPAIGAEMAFAKGAPLPVAALAQAAPAPEAPAPSPAFVVPVNGTVSDRFGMRKDPFDDQMKFHEGMDFVAPTGTPVKASAAGTVTFSGNRWGFGTTVEIDHANGMRTRYAHLSRADVKAGETVTAGQLIGAVGTTGKSTKTPHLHFEVWQDGKPINPETVLATDTSLGAN